VMVCPPAVHLNPDIYACPLTFNPSRFKVCTSSPVSTNVVHTITFKNMQCTYISFTIILYYTLHTG
jgi:cytochrome P450